MKAPPMSTTSDREIVTDACRLCGDTSEPKRECYWFDGQEKFDRTCFVPRLEYEERYRLEGGFNTLCANRTRCRERQYINAKAKGATK